MALRAVVDHPKFFRLKSLLRLNKSCALGYLEALWHFCGRYTPQGNLGKYSDEDIEAWMEWDGEPGALIESLIKSKWIDRHPAHRLIVHDWHQHADDATRKALGRAHLGFVTKCPDVVAIPSGKSRDKSGPPGAGPEPGSGAGPEPEPEGDAGPIPPTQSKPKADPIRDESWHIFAQIALKAGMRASDDEFRTVADVLWPRLDFEQRRLAIEGVSQRLDSGEYSDPAFVPLLDSYVRKKLWKRPLRAAPSRASPKQTYEQRNLAALRSLSLEEETGVHH